MRSYFIVSRLQSLWLIAIIASVLVRAQIWEHELLIDGREASLSHEAMFLDVNGRIHSISGGDNLYYTWYDGQNWECETVYEEFRQIRYASLAVGVNDTVHAVFYDAYTRDIIHASRGDSGWESRILMKTFNPFVSPLRFDSNGALHTIFFDQQNQNIHAVFRDNAWEYQALHVSGLNLAQAGFDLDSNDCPHFLANDQETLKHFYPDGSLWQVETITEKFGLDLRLALDSNDCPHVLFIEAGAGLQYAVRNSAEWQIVLLYEDASANGSICLDVFDTPHIIVRGANYLTHVYPFDELWIREPVNQTFNYQPGVSIGFDTESKLHVLAGNDSLKVLTHLTRNTNEWTEEKIWHYGKIGPVGSLCSIVDENNTLHTLFTTEADNKLIHASLSDRVWSYELIEDWLGSGSGHCSIGVDQNNMLHIGFYCAREMTFYHAQQTSQGWLKDKVTEGIEIISSDMALGKEGNLSIVCSIGTDILFYRFESGIWHMESYGPGTYGCVSICLDLAGNPHCACYVKDYQSSWTVVHLYKDQDVWKRENMYPYGIDNGIENIAIRCDSSGVLKAGFGIAFRSPHVQYHSAISVMKDQDGWKGLGICPTWYAHYNSFCLDICENPCFSIYNGSYRELQCYSLSNTNTPISSIVRALPCGGSNSSICVDRSGLLHIMHTSDGNLNHSYYSLPETGVRLDMPSQSYQSSQICYLNAYLRSNADPLTQAPLCILLEYQDNYWFWPNWNSSFDIKYTDVNATGQTLSVVNTFNWPKTEIGPVEGLTFWGALLNQDMTEIIGGVDGIGKWEFSAK